jgi:broad specificity phosphatase PhoE
VPGPRARRPPSGCIPRRAFDEIRAGDLDGARTGAYWSWRDQHTAADRPPHGESIDDALRRYAGALRRLLAREEQVTLVVIHEIALRSIAAAASTSTSVRV